ncbi:MAG: hypothetical protein HQK89_06155 [Nitrospirae bacterium]|nr:hypothetical protein [Nitrospirota bacterium]
MVDLNAFNALIRNKCGLRFEKNRMNWLKESIINRMKFCGLSSPLQYFNLIQVDTVEFTNLVNLLTINETYFFREQGQLSLFTDRLVPMISKKISGRIRILSAGCATGEEPYSIAIALMEKYGPDFDKRFSIAATDIDSDTIKKAIAGVYSGNSFRKFSESLMDKYFSPTDRGQYLVKDFIRTAVYFENTNILACTENPRFKDMDVIFYRNVSIYFDCETREKALENLKKLMREGGYLIVSSVETMSNDLGILHPIELDGFFLYQKTSDNWKSHDYKTTQSITKHHDITRRHDVTRDHAITREQDMYRETVTGKAACTATLPLTDVRVKPHGTSSMKLPGLPNAYRIDEPTEIVKEKKTSVNGLNTEDIEDLIEKSMILINEKQYPEALHTVDTAIAMAPNSARAHMLKAFILFNTKSFRQAGEVCLKTMALDQWNYDAYIILGLIAKQDNDGKEALKRFKEAIYIDSSSWLAHYHAGDTYSVLGENDHAEREYSIVIKLLEKAAGGLGPTLFYRTFNSEQILHLCRHNIKQLRKLRGT